MGCGFDLFDLFDPHGEIWCHKSTREDLNLTQENGARHQVQINQEKVNITTHNSAKLFTD